MVLPFLLYSGSRLFLRTSESRLLFFYGMVFLERICKDIWANEKTSLVTEVGRGMALPSLQDRRGMVLPFLLTLGVGSLT